MDGAVQAEGPGAEGDYGSDDKRGFRGTSENSKTKICMRSASCRAQKWYELINDQQSKRLTLCGLRKVEGWTLQIW